MEKNSSKIEELRELYKAKRFWEFKRLFWIYAFQLEKEDRENAYRALNKLTTEQTKMPEEIEYALKELGGKIV